MLIIVNSLLITFLIVILCFLRKAKIKNNNIALTCLATIIHISLPVKIYV